MQKIKILISGSSGLIGSALVPFLENQGFEIGRLLRYQQDKHPYWFIEKQQLHLKQFHQADIVINLAGENIANGRWTANKKEQLISSRISSTELLVTHFKQQKVAPKLFINASAIGFYGDRQQSVVDENSSAGDHFVSQLATQWEQTSQPIKSAHTRLVNLRTGIVLTQQGGVLGRVLPIFKLGLGGKIGNGKQVMSWIDLVDFCRALLFIINTHSLHGPINLVAPNPVTNSQFTQILAKQLKRPNLLPVPKWLVKLLFAQMGEELLLSSTHVLPKKLLESGFEFHSESLPECLARQLK